MSLRCLICHPFFSASLRIHFIRLMKSWNGSDLVAPSLSKVVQLIMEISDGSNPVRMKFEK